jgi:endoglucanase
VLAAALAVALTASAGAGRSGNPFSGARRYRLKPGDVGADAAQAAEAMSQSNPGDAAEMTKLAVQPWAEWYGGWLSDPGGLFRQRIQQWYAPDLATAFIAVYNLPHRDCSGVFSAGGASSPAAYKAWIDNIAGGIGEYPTIVVVEPDGLPDTPCLGSLAAQRLQLITYATKTLASLPNTSVYIDAGRSDWLRAGKMISLLRRAGVRYARGFSLDVTGYATTRAELRYGDTIGRALGGKHFIINTSRNGNGPLGAKNARSVQELWCNSPGRALGPRPTTNTGDPLADGFEWVLHPGYSDGTCQGGPTAGSWWPQDALGLARRAHY